MLDILTFEHRIGAVCVGFNWQIGVSFVLVAEDTYLYE